MTFINEQLPLTLIGGVVESQRLVVPPEVVLGLPTYRHACRMAWNLRRPRNLKQRTLAELAGLYAPHVSDYFSVNASRRELPAKCIGLVERVVGNTVISQWIAHQCNLTVVEEMQAARLSMRQVA